MVTILATIFFEKRFWVATFERTDQEGYAIARHIFGGEPTNPEIHQFVLDHYNELNFGEPKDFQLEIKRKSPKRVQREVRREMERAKETQKPSTLAQDYMREELEKGKQEKRARKSEIKRTRQAEQFVQKQQKKREKRQGH